MTRVTSRSAPTPSVTLLCMLFMVIERFKQSDLNAVAERFGKHGRMLPEGVIYHSSWMEPTGYRCFQIMDAPERAALDSWISHWADLVDFEIVPVLTSAEFWARGAPRSSV